MEKEIESLRKLLETKLEEERKEHKRELGKWQNKVSMISERIGGIIEGKEKEIEK